MVYEKLQRQLEKSSRLSWIAEEMAVLNDPGNYRADPDWLAATEPRGASPRLLGVLKEVAAWRERTAQRIDIPASACCATSSCWRSRAIRPRRSRSWR